MKWKKSALGAMALLILLVAVLAAHSAWKKRREDAIREVAEAHGVIVGTVVDEAEASSISGHVVDLDTGEKLGGVTLIAQGADLTEHGRGYGETVSDESGEFRFFRLSEGRYQLHVKSERFVLHPTSSFILVQEGKQVCNLDVEVHGAAEIRGRVTDKKTGTPLAKVIVRAEHRSPMISAPDAEAITAQDGRYRMPALSAGEYTVRAETDMGDEVPEDEFRRLDLAWGEKAEGIDFSLGRGVMVRGRVVNSLGKPVEGATVSWRGPFDRKRTDKNGAFKLTGIPRGAKCSFHAKKGKLTSAKVAYKLDEDVNEIELRFTEPEQPKSPPKNWVNTPIQEEEDEDFSIAGQITDSQDQPVKAAEIRANHQWVGDGPSPRTGSAKTDSTGTYEIKKLDQNLYRISVRHPDHLPGAKRRVRGGSDDVDFVLLKAGNVEGRVIDAASGKPLPQFNLSRSKSSLGLIGYPSKPHGVLMSDPDGRFSLTLTTPGKWTLAASAKGFASSCVTADVVAEQVTEDIVLRLHREASLEGRVFDGQGKPLAGATIHRGRVHDSRGSKSSLLGRAGQDGTFRVSGFAPGKYLVYAFHKKYRSVEKRFEAKPGKATAITFTLAEVR